MKTIRCLLIASISLLAGRLSGEPVEVKLATILPDKVSQDFILIKLGQDWRKASGGTVELRKAPGGRKDGEAGIVKKLKSGNYQAALLSAVGLCEIEKDVAALQMMPLVFRDWDEIDFVRERIRARLEDLFPA